MQLLELKDAKEEEKAVLLEQAVKLTIPNIEEKSISDLVLSISELNSLAQQISNESLPLKEWTTDFNIIQTSGGFNTELHFGDIKPYFSDGYSWLYSTTYWNNSTFKDLTTQNNYNREFYFLQSVKRR